MSTDDTPPAGDEWLTAALRSLPSPTMPPEVASRISASIAAESAARETSRETPPVTNVTRLRTRSRWILAAGGIAAAGLVAAFVVGQVNTAPPVPLAQTPPTPQTRASADAGAPIPSTGNPSDPTPPEVSFVQPISSGTTYSAASLEAAVADHMQDMPSTPAPPAARAASFARSPAGIKSCLKGVGMKAVELRMIDLAQYEDLPSAVMAFRAGDQDPTTDVVVVGVQCNQTAPQLRASMTVEATQ